MNPSHYATFDLQGRLRVQIVTYEDVSVCNLSPNFSCFISTTTFPHKCVIYETRHAHVRTLQDECLHTFWLTKICLCVTFSIWHNIFHLTTHICSRNDVPPLEFNLRTLLCILLLTHETMSENINFTDSKDNVHCKKTCLYANFWLTCKFWHTNKCLCTLSNIIFIASSNVTCLYKLYQLWDVTMYNFSLKDAFLYYFDLRGRLQVQIFT